MKKPMTPAEMGRKGGKARMSAMTKAERTEFSRQAALKRWAKAKKQPPRIARGK